MMKKANLNRLAPMCNKAINRRAFQQAHLSEDIDLNELIDVLEAEATSVPYQRHYTDRGALLNLINERCQPATEEALMEKFYRHPRIREMMVHLAMSMTDSQANDAIARIEQITGTVRAANNARKNKSTHNQPIIADNWRVDDPHAWLSEPAARHQIPETAANVEGEHIPITAQNICHLRDHLRSNWYPVSFCLDEQASHDPRLAGSLMVEASWSTGLRPGEWSQSYIRVRSRGTGEWSYGIDAVATRVSDRPMMARPGVDTRQAAVADAIAEVLRNNETWLHCKTGKSAKWARQKGLPLVRSMNISDLPASTQAVIFCLSWGAARIGTSNWKKLLGRSRHVLKSAVRHVLPGRDPSTLMYRNLRQDFADRARVTLDRTQIAVLMGHTTTGSLQNYGRKYRGLGMAADRKASISVRPDPAAVEHMHMVLQNDIATRAARDRMRSAMKDERITI